MTSRETRKLQYASAITACLTTAGAGCIMAWSSPALPYLMSEKSYLQISKEESDWTASVALPGLVTGQVLFPIIISKIGAKRTLLTFALPQMLSWLLIVVATDLNTLYIARILGGIGYGGGLCATVLYLSEIDKESRGQFMVLISLSLNMGTLFTMLTGSYMPYTYMNITLLMIPILFIVMFIFMPDSSYFDEKDTEKEESMKLKLQKPEETQINKSELQGGLLVKNESKIKKTGLWIKLLASRSNRRALLILTILSCQLVFSGDVFLISFAHQIFTYSGSAINAQNSAIVMACMKIISCFISTQVVERVRRKVLLASEIFGSIGMGLVGVYFLLEEQKVDVSSIKWMPVIGVTIYNIMFPISYSNLFIVYQGELFTNDVKSLAIFINNSSFIGFSFLGLFKFQELFDALGSANLFFIFSIFGAISTLLLFVITPETKGRNIDEIQDLLKSRKFFCF